MPDGLTHYKYFKRGYLVELPLTLSLVFLDWQFALGNIVGYSFHRWCDNDWDLTTATASDGRAMRELPILGNFLFGISSTYASFFRKTHRKTISHAPFISTAIRLLFVWLVPFIFLDSWGINLIGGGWHMFWVGWYFGQSSADTVHYYLDLTHGD